jgi:hypothetical protein
MVAPLPTSSFATNIRFPQSPFLDPQTLKPAREWIIWLQNPNLVSQTVNFIIINGGTISNVAIKNSTINSSTIGLTTPAEGQFTKLTALDGIGGGTF